MFYDFIEIGTSDFDTEIQKKDEKIGISIDAVKYYIDKLPNKNNCIKLNLGISNYNGYITVYYLKSEIIKKYNLPMWTKGCNSVNGYHPTVYKLLFNKGISIKNVISSYRVQCITLNSLFSQYNIKGVYLLKIDTEGHDYVILDYYFQNNNSKLLPHKIIFESNSLTNIENTKKIIDMTAKKGYDLISSNHDTILKLNLNKINKKFTFFDKIVNYFIEDYPPNYCPHNLPHENTLEAAKKYCIKHKCSGITYQYNRYEVRNGKYINYESKLVSWVLL